MLNNLDQHMKTAEATTTFVPLTGTRAEQGAELIRRCLERDKKLEAQALECERLGDADGTWLNMAARAENMRFIEQIAANLKREQSPALAHQSKHYPPHFAGRVPKRIKMLMTVRPDSLCTLTDKSWFGVELREGEIYEAWTNSHGAVSGICPGGKRLGVKSDEFEVVEWHEQNDSTRPTVAN